METQMGHVKSELSDRYMKAKSSKEKLDLLLHELKDDKTLEEAFKTWKLSDIIGLLLQRNFTLIDIKEILEIHGQLPEVEIPSFFYWQPLDMDRDRIVNPPQEN